ncbi:hypothetical protein CONLIGDRAFT_649060 [Coniochaeta ligniaria NRRL 30616]|uniref:Uncharacterized protein n=1 Tax=Coniochaeta ligniaria NRRL 30616 TaxID=1408157 RepID=A0A1J7IA45_9PEZI|nr:hypothetical protein CONLIGDRAFT_649060 [Coniochaeta ligniaria NRRL 30616]
MQRQCPGVLQHRVLVNHGFEYLTLETGNPDKALIIVSETRKPIPYYANRQILFIDFLQFSVESLDLFTTDPGELRQELILAIRHMPSVNTGRKVAAEVILIWITQATLDVGEEATNMDITDITGLRNTDPLSKDRDSDLVPEPKRVSENHTSTGGNSFAG